MHILISNVGHLNKGNVALVKSTIYSIQHFFPDVTFTLMGPEYLVFDGYEVKKQLGVGISRTNAGGFIKSVYYLLYCIVIWLLSKANIQISFKKDSKLHDYYNCDLFVNSGGDHLSGEYGFGTLGAFFNILYAMLLGKKVVLFGESLGYFKSPLLILLSQYIFNHVDLILLRDEISQQYLESNKINKPLIYITADPAFLLEPISSLDAMNIIQEEGIKTLKRPLIGINASSLLGNFVEYNEKRKNDYIENIFAQAIDNILMTMDATVILIPHVYSQTNDDRVTISKIKNLVKNHNKLCSLQKEYSPEELKGVIGLCDLFVGARMHSTIASTSMLIPTVGIAYSHKMYGVIGKMLDQNEYILDKDELNVESLTLKIIEAWKNRESIKTTLAAKMPTVKERALLNGKLIKNIVISEKNEYDEDYIN